jgi:hypothetical protein
MTQVPRITLSPSARSAERAVIVTLVVAADVDVEAVDASSITMFPELVVPPTRTRDAVPVRATGVRLMMPGMPPLRPLPPLRRVPRRLTLRLRRASRLRLPPSSLRSRRCVTLSSGYPGLRCAVMLY